MKHSSGVAMHRQNYLHWTALPHPPALGSPTRNIVKTVPLLKITVENNIAVYKAHHAQETSTCAWTKHANTSTASRTCRESSVASDTAVNQHAGAAAAALRGLIPAPLAPCPAPP